MLETLFTIGPLQLRTISLFQAIAFFAAGLVIWKRSKEEHWSEPQVFDGFLLSFLIGWICARFGYFLLNWDKFGFDLFKWLNFVQYPGSQLVVGIVGATLYFYSYARKKKWDAFEVLDWWSQAVTMGLLWLNVGYFFAGIYFGDSTSLPWGIIFPGVFEKRHPIQLYYVIFHAGIYYLLNWLEFHYRTFQWYRAGKKTALTGFLFINFMATYAVFSFIASFLRPSVFKLGDLVLDRWLYFVMALIATWLLLLRSNRLLFSFKEKKFFVIKK
jgi:phosphatidylglycerol---prolipoprotein diacylglyceryl transferase